MTLYLPQGTLVAPQLYYPVDGELHYASASAGEIVAWIPSGKHSKIFDVSLNKGITDDSAQSGLAEGRPKLYKSRRLSIIPLLLSINFGTEIPTTIDELIKKEYLFPTNYARYFMSMGDLDMMDKAFNEIPTNRSLVYITTCKGHEKIILGKDSGKHIPKPGLGKASPQTIPVFGSTS